MRFRNHIIWGESMFRKVLFYTNKLKPLLRFYRNILELDIINNEQTSFTVSIGTSELTFVESDLPAFYHYAINIPGNQFSQIKYWIKDKLTLNREGGIDEVYFPSFDADSMYFEDPAGNIIELIGRRNRDLFGYVTSDAFFNISEVGIVTPHMEAVGDDLQDIGIPLRHGTEVNPKSVNFLGKNDTFIVLTPPERRWYFSKQQSKIYPLEITLSTNIHLKLDKNGEFHVTELSEDSDET